MPFPPIPQYPTNYDSDTTLFLVYNTAEAVTTLDVDAWAEEVPVRPRGSDEDEVWANNGYANIAGELFYYDAVQKDGNGKVCRLKRCLRNIGGRTTQFNSAGTWVRGFVIAEHHNQIVDATLLVENFVGENFSPDTATLDWRIRNLSDSPIQGDDYCPEVQFKFDIVSSSPATGTTANYNVSITGGGAFTLQFGDGTATSVSGDGTHVYAPGANIDPVVVINSDNCQIVQSPIFRTNPTTPSSPNTVPPFITPLPVPFEIPQIVIPTISVPVPETNIPPVVFPCISPISPSVVIIKPQINTPSTISISPVPLRVKLTPPVSLPITITGGNINIPSRIVFDGPRTISITPPPPIPPIRVIPPNIPPIRFANPPSMPSVIQIKGGNLPSLIKIKPVGGGNFPKKGVFSVVGFPVDGLISLIGHVPRFISLIGLPNGGNMSLIHNIPQSLKVDPIPKLQFDSNSVKRVMSSFSEELVQALRVSMPKFDDIKVNWGDTPTLKATFKMERKTKRRNMLLGTDEDVVEETDFPNEFKLVAPSIPPLEFKLPDGIELRAPKEGLTMSVVPFTIPPLTFDMEPFKTLAIPVKMPKPEDMPSFGVDMPKTMPSFGVEFPKNIPTIKVEVPDNTRIPLIYEGPPIPVQPVTMNIRFQNLAGEAENDIACVSIVPCRK